MFDWLIIFGAVSLLVMLFIYGIRVVLNYPGLLDWKIVEKAKSDDPEEGSLKFDYEPTPLKAHRKSRTSIPHIPHHHRPSLPSAMERNESNMTFEQVEVASGLSDVPSMASCEHEEHNWTLGHDTIVVAQAAFLDMEEHKLKAAPATPVAAAPASDKNNNKKSNMMPAAAAEAVCLQNEAGKLNGFHADKVTAINEVIVRQC